jgi:NAD(P)-dependent dehydrogenase (short-subunit alcohol dehydrogenase family)
MRKLADRLVLITGANRGIGFAISQALAREGARVLMVGRNRRRVEAAAKRAGARAVPLVADVTKPAEVRRLFARVRRRFGRLDALVNNAGVFTCKPFARTTLREFRSNLDANLTSIFLCTQAALPLLERGRDAHVVSVLSIAALQAFPNNAAYCAAKFGARGLMNVLREELRPKKIRVTSILPGSTDTRLVNAFDFPFDRRKLLKPRDVAEMVAAVLTRSSHALVEEIVMTPSAGKL